MLNTFPRTTPLAKDLLAHSVTGYKCVHFKTTTKRQTKITSDTKKDEQQQKHSITTHKERMSKRA